MNLYQHTGCTILGTSTNNSFYKGIEIDKSSIDNYGFIKCMTVDPDLDFVCTKYTFTEISNDYLPHLFDLVSNITSDVEFEADSLLDYRHSPTYNTPIKFKNSPSYVNCIGYFLSDRLKNDCNSKFNIVDLQVEPISKG